MLPNALRLLAAGALALAASASTSGDDARLRVRGADGVWRTWWTAAQAPARWAAGSTALGDVVRWTTERHGLDVADVVIAAEGGLLPALRVRVVLVRVDPTRQALTLHAATRAGGGAGPWDLDRAPGDASFAVNAGQFTDAGPWGWVVHRGRVLQAPGVGPLSAALVIDDQGAARVLPADSLGSARGVVEAVQSYPALLDGDGVVPRALREPGSGVDLTHRDARLAVCELRDGRLLFALTRFDHAGELLGAVPLGLTVPETAALAGALGCRRAMMLDGGLSAQMLVREPAGAVRRWAGLRQVPLGIVAREVSSRAQRGIY